MLLLKSPASTTRNSTLSDFSLPAVSTANPLKLISPATGITLYDTNEYETNHSFRPSNTFSHGTRRPAHPRRRKGFNRMITIENIKGKSNPSRHLVRRDGCPIGLLEKFRNTSMDTHPWKAFFYSSLPPAAITEYLGAFYRWQGGKRAAIQSIITRATT